MLQATARGWWRDAFASSPVARRWLLLLFVAINAVVGWNAVRHHPRVGYDTGQHLKYVDVLAKGRLPRRAETAAYYAPPLPYVAPSLARGIARASLATAGKVAQIFQVGLSLALTLGLLIACQHLRAGDGAFKLAVLGLCGMPAVYYRTFAMLRGEVYLATLGVLAVAVVLGAIARGTIDHRRSLVLGLLGAGIALSRQLGLVLLVGLGVFFVIASLRGQRRYLAGAAAAGLLAAVAAGWFYLGLRAREGAMLSWNLPRVAFSLANQPTEFYAGTGDGELFTAPGRPRFQKQFAPVLFADWWGDYWHYFLFRGRRASGACVPWPAPPAPNAPAVPDSDFSGNYASMLAYLGWVNRVALVPTAVLLAGLVVGARELQRFAVRGRMDAHTQGVALVFLLAASTLIGYLWFVISYPRADDGDTVKATYVFQIVPLLALLGGEALVRLRSLARAAFAVSCALLVAVGLFVAPAAVTRWGTPLDCRLPGYKQ